MKKGQLKLEEKTSKKPSEFPFRATINPNYFINTHSAQNLRVNNILPKEKELPVKNQATVKNVNRRPQFLKKMSKGGGGVNQPTEDRKAEERKSNKQAIFFAREEQIGAAQGIKKDSPQKIKLVKAKQLRETVKYDMSDYQKLNEKLNYIQNKIKQMSENIDKKRQEKRNFLENQRKERQRKFDKWNHGNQPQQNKLKQSLRKFVTQVNEGKDYVGCNFNPYSPKHHTYYVSEILKFYQEDRSLAREHIAMSAQYLKIFNNIKAPSEQEISLKVLKLPKKPSHQEKKTVIFDLDETLIHCNDTLEVPYDVKLRIKFPTGQQIEAGVNIRPYAVQLLKALNKNFEVIVFTASHSCYANVVLDYLDPQNQLIHHRLFRQHCHVTQEGVYVKDIRVVNRDLSQVCLIDNAAYSYAFQLDNAIPIIPYYKGKNDFQLKALQTYLQNLLVVKDVRQVNRKTFKLHRYKEQESIEQLVRELYSQQN